MSKINIFWFRRDLRLQDNAGLYQALKSGNPVLPIFIFDENILEKLEDRDDARVSFLHETLTDLKAELENLGSTLSIFYGKPNEIWADILKKIPSKKCLLTETMSLTLSCGTMR